MQLESMSFPGNVRELKNIIERAVALSDAPWISLSELLVQDEDSNDPSTTTLRQTIEQAEQIAIHKALEENDYKINHAADALGISRKNLWEKMKRYDINK